MKDRSLTGTLILASLEIAILLAGIYLIHFDDRLLYAPGTPKFWRVLLYFVMTVALLNVVTRLIKWLYQRQNYAKRRGAKNFIYGVENIRKLLIGGVVVFTVFSLIGIDFTALFTGLSLVAAAIAIVSKDFVNDLIVGIYYSFTDVFEVGDYVRFYTYRGRVTDIGLLKVKILNDNDDVVILPNGKIYTSEIINYTRRDVRLLSIDFEMDIKAITDVNELERELIESIRGFSDLIEPNSYLLKIVEVKKDYMEIKFQFRLRYMDRERQREVKRKVVREVFSYVSSHKPR
ncbi:small-conductance mechanosensitive channel [Neolewinella xylanilytica]|uniref:Small-conductance mechanosensitive channel n=1 Tax=Neolewinella xylanilytica TaxID=1514080 RepID=A0A2S6I509_9BACT|nr:mechanosensitive ion channel domain-containing protein [Neolewinella xylanilytica]PPK86232.1 small-conductance mechanosensitive channel [Neolewinella xylanilytica]